MKKDKDFDKEDVIDEPDTPDIEGADIDDELLPDTFREEDDGGSEKKKSPKAKKGMTKKKIIMLISFALATVALLLVYLFVIKPIYDEREAENNAGTEPEAMIEGEVRASDGVSILLHKHIEMANTRKVTVTNPDPLLGGKFTIVRDETDKTGNTYYVQEHGELAPIKAETYLNVIVAAGYPVMSRRISENCTDLSVYGLAEEDYPRQVTIEDLAGNTYTFYIGDLIAAEGGYYCRAEGRNAVYIIAYDSISILMSTSESLLQPVLGPTFDSNSALMLDFVMSKNGQQFVSIRFTEVNTDDVRQSAYEMTFPAAYGVYDEQYTASVLGALATLEGYMVVACGDGTVEGKLYKNEALMAQYGFYDTENPPYEVYYELEDVAGYIMFTESGSDAYYYAYSLIWDTIVLIEKTSVPFLEWDLLEFVNKSLFYEYIRDVSALTVKGQLDYQQKTHEIDEKITYWYDENDNMWARAESTGFTYTGRYEDSNYALGFYLVALSLDIEGYISEKDANFDMANAKEYARFIIDFVDGTQRTYVFYKFSGYCYFTIDGSGEFYVSTSTINRLMVNAVRVANNCPVDSYAEYPAMPDNYLERID